MDVTSSKIRMNNNPVRNFSFSQTCWWRFKSCGIWRLYRSAYSYRRFGEAWYIH